MKFFFLIIFLNLALFGQVNFKETKHISAVDIDIVKYGTLDIKKDILVINYTKPNKELINYYSNRIEILQDNQTKTYSFKEYPNAQYMGVILRAIKSNEYELLDQLFKIEKKQSNITLIAKPIIYNYINTIEIIKKKEDIIIINMTNKDKITIETIN